MSTEFTKLVSEYLDNPGQDTLAAIEREASRDPEFLVQYVEMMRLHRMMKSELSQVDLVSRFRREFRSSRSGSPRAKRGRRVLHFPWPWMAAAAVILAIGGTFAWFIAESDDRSNFYSLGGVSRIDGGHAIAIPEGARIVDGLALVASDPDRGGGIAGNDGTKILMGYRTRLSLGTDGDGRVLRLEQGEITAEVGKQPTGHPMEIYSPHMIATIVGTKFTMRDSEKAFLSVQEGVVAVSDPARTETVEIRAGSWVTIGPDRRIQHVESSLWRLDSMVDRARILGKVTKDVQTATARLESISRVPDNPYFKADQIICVQPPLSSRSLFSIPDGFGLHFRIRSRTSAHAVVTLEVPKLANNQADSFCSVNIQVGEDWSDVVLRPGDFQKSLAGNPIRAGLEIQTLCVWGFGSGAIEISDVSLGR